MQFRGRYYFLSNFYPCSIEIDGVRYESAEAAFQGQKSAQHAHIIEELQQTLQEFEQKEFQQKLENGLISIKPTEFMCIDTNGEMTILDSKEIPIGTLIGGDNIEAFHVLTFDDDGKPWVLTTNLQMSYEAFAQMMRSQCTLPKIIHWAAK